MERKISEGEAAALQCANALCCCSEKKRKVYDSKGEDEVDSGKEKERKDGRERRQLSDANAAPGNP